MLGGLFQSRSPNQERVPKGQRLTNGFPIMTYGATPNITRQEWQFRVWGCAMEKVFTWDDFMAMPQTEFTADFHCVTTWSKLDVKWKGIKVTDFLKYIEVDPTAIHIMEHSYGDYTTNLAIEDFVKEENFFAHTLFDQPLPIDNGGPMRLVVPHLYAWKSAKWINGIEFLDKMQLGFWERNGYHHRGEPFAEERYSSV